MPVNHFFTLLHLKIKLNKINNQNWIIHEGLLNNNVCMLKMYTQYDCDLSQYKSKTTRGFVVFLFCLSFYPFC